MRKNNIRFIVINFKNVNDFLIANIKPLHANTTNKKCHLNYFGKNEARLEDGEIGRWRDWEIGRLGDWEIGRWRDWKYGRLGFLFFNLSIFQSFNLSSFRSMQPLIEGFSLYLVP
jgi:hypothetical protein